MHQEVKIKGCPKKDENGNHYVHRLMWNHKWWQKEYAWMCNSQGRFAPVSKIHPSRKGGGAP